MSRGFVRETAFKLLNKPEVVTKLGHIIKPLDKEDVFKKKVSSEDINVESGTLSAGKGNSKNDSRSGGFKAGKNKGKQSPSKFSKKSSDTVIQKGKEKRKGIS